VTHEEELDALLAAHAYVLALERQVHPEPHELERARATYRRLYQRVRYLLSLLGILPGEKLEVR